MIGQGQINEKTERWKLIQNVINNNINIKNIVEIGTCTGAGSTLCILNSNIKNSTFISIESNLNYYDTALKNLKDYSDNVTLIYGRIIEVDDIRTFLSSVELDQTQSQWLESDLNDFNKCDNVINQIPDEIDFLLLDGGEFSTYCEWEKLKDRTKIVALDDINVLKCNKIFRELTEDSNYDLLSKTDEGNGFCIFKKNDL